MYCGPHTASEVFRIFTTQLYQYFSVFLLLIENCEKVASASKKKKKKNLLLIALFSNEPEVFLPKYSQTAILHAAHSRRVVHLPVYWCTLMVADAGEDDLIGEVLFEE